MPSGQRQEQPDPTTPIFFLDRSVGKYTVAGALRQIGVKAIHMGEVYPDDGQYVSDPEWIERCGQEGWVALSKDPAAGRDHLDAVEEAGLQLFVFSNANVTGEENVRRVHVNWGQILSLTKRPGPYVYTIMANSLRKRWPHRNRVS